MDCLLRPAAKQLENSLRLGWTANVRPRLRARTFADYKHIVEQHLVPALGKVPLPKLGPEYVRDLFAAKTEAELSPRRISVIRAVLHTALAEAVTVGDVARNVADLVKAPRGARYQPKPLDARQARAFLKAGKKHRLGALFGVALGVGSVLARRWVWNGAPLTL